jgi:hypothetical protein
MSYSSALALCTSCFCPEVCAGGVDSDNCEFVSFIADFSSSDALFVASLNGNFRGVSTFIARLDFAAITTEKIIKGENRKLQFRCDFTVLAVHIERQVAGTDLLIHS